MPHRNSVHIPRTLFPRLSNNRFGSTHCDADPSLREAVPQPVDCRRLICAGNQPAIQEALGFGSWKPPTNAWGGSGGVLEGQLVDAQGVPKAGVDVSLLLEQRSLAVTQTDAQGRFAFRGVRGGVYQLTAANGTGSYRVWSPGTEPKGTPAMALMTAGDVVRGQYYGYGHGYQCHYGHSYLGQAKCLLANPWVVSGIVATAVAVPVGIHNADSGDAPASP